MSKFVNLSVFNTSDFGDPCSTVDGEYLGPNDTKYTNVTQCRYRGFRNGPGEENQYENSDVWMHVFTARLVFIVVFEVTRKYPLRTQLLGEIRF